MHVYACLAEFKDFMREQGSTSLGSNQDATMLSVLESASRRIDEFCQRSPLRHGLRPAHRDQQVRQQRRQLPLAQRRPHHHDPRSPSAPAPATPGRTSPPIPTTSSRRVPAPTATRPTGASSSTTRRPRWASSAAASAPSTWSGRGAIPTSPGRWCRPRPRRWTPRAGDRRVGAHGHLARHDAPHRVRAGLRLSDDRRRHRLDHR